MGRRVKEGEDLIQYGLIYIRLHAFLKVEGAEGKGEKRNRVGAPDGKQDCLG